MTNDVTDFAVLIIVAMFLIVIVYLVAQQLFGMVPAAIGTTIIGLASAYIYATNKAIRESINSWMKKRKQ